MGFGRGYLLRKWGVLGNPRRAPSALAADAVICAGQAVFDHNLAGIRGRVHGYRAATPGQGKWLEGVSGAWTLLLYLNLGAVPLLWRWWTAAWEVPA